MGWHYIAPSVIHSQLVIQLDFLLNYRLLGDGIMFPERKIKGWVSVSHIFQVRAKLQVIIIRAKIELDYWTQTQVS